MTREEAKADIYVGESTGVAWTNAEEVIDQIYNYFETIIAEHENMIEALDEFFDSNICIPRGANRHIVIYADIDDKYAIYSDGRLLNKELGRFTVLAEHSHGYLRVYLDCKDTYVHRLVAEYFCEGRTDERNQVNHIDGNKANNNYTNLEWVTNQENMNHAVINDLHVRGKKHKHNTSGYVGVTSNKKTGKYQAQISVNGKKQYLGVFKTAEEAAIKYNEASMLIYGDAPNEVV